MKQILYFRANWCNQCKITTPIVDKLQAEGLPIKTIDAMKEPEKAQFFGVMSLPNFILVDGDKVLDQKLGNIREVDLRDWLV